MTVLLVRDEHEKLLLFGESVYKPTFASIVATTAAVGYGIYRLRRSTPDQDAKAA